MPRLREAMSGGEQGSNWTTTGAEMSRIIPIMTGITTGEGPRISRAPILQIPENRVEGSSDPTERPNPRLFKPRAVPCE
jgi:hypothetical protein